MKTVIDFVLHLDAHLAEIAASYGTWMCGFLFVVVQQNLSLIIIGIVVVSLLPMRIKFIKSRRAASSDAGLPRGR